MKRNSPLNLVKLRLDDNSEINYPLIMKAREGLRRFAAGTHSEFASVSNALPLSLIIKYPSLIRFYILKWLYRHEKMDHPIPYQSVEIPDPLYAILEDGKTLFESIDKTVYIWDQSVFRSITDDISYFYEIGLLTASERNEIRGGLLELLAELEALTANGCFANGNAVDIYISHTYFDTSYGYICADNLAYSMIKVFVLNMITSHDPRVMEEIKGWMQALKRQAFLISGTGEMQRVMFLTKQRRLIEA